MPSNKLKTYAKIVRNEQKILSAREKEAGREGSLAAELIRNTHSIEKGLSHRMTSEEIVRFID